MSQTYDKITSLSSGTEHPVLVEAAIRDGDGKEIAATYPKTAQIAPIYSDDAAYAVGDYVTYDNEIYQCNTAVDHEAWNSSKWTAVSSLAGKISDLEANTQPKLTAGNNITIDSSNVISASSDVSFAGDQAAGHIVATGEAAKTIVDTGVDVDSIKRLSMGITKDGYVRFEDIPGLKVGDKITVHVVGTNSNCHIKAVAYPGKNICNIAAVNHENMVSNLLGARDTLQALSAGAYYYAPANATSGFVAATSLSGVSSSAKKITIQAEHKYLLMADFTCIARTDDQQKAFAPSLFGIYDNTSGISGTATPTADSANTDTAKKFYAFVKPTWSVTQNADTKIMNSDLKTTGLCIIQDGNSTGAIGYTYTQDTDVTDAASYASEVEAKGMLFIYDEATSLYKKSTAYDASATYYYRTADGTADQLNSFVVIDITDAADDAYSLNTTTLIITEANTYARYKASYATLAAGTDVTSGKAIGPWGNSTMQRIRMYYRQLYAKVPAHRRLYIRCYKGVTSAGVPSGYIKTLCVNNTGNSVLGSALTLDQAVTLNAACIEYLYSTDANAVVSTPSSDQTMLMYYSTRSENTDYVAYQLPTNVKTGESMPYGEAFSATTCVLYGSGTGEAEYTVTVSGASDYITGSLSFIAENSSYLPVYAENVTDSGNDKTHISFFVDSVNDAIVALRNQVAKINANSLLTTLPTAKGTYKYEVATEGVPGTWSKEEETVIDLTTELVPGTNLLNAKDVDTIFSLIRVHKLVGKTLHYRWHPETAEGRFIECYGIVLGYQYGGYAGNNTGISVYYNQGS